MTTMTTIPAGWYADPTRQHEFRWWDGAAWTANVSDRGVVVTEPRLPWAAAPAAQPAAAQPAATQPAAAQPPASAATAGADEGGGSAAQVAALVDEGLAMIEANVTINADGSFYVLGGSESPVMDGANKLAEAVAVVPGDLPLRLAWISALATAAQWKEARDRLTELVETRPEFLPARIAAAGVEKWTPMFMLPPWTPSTVEPHPRISAFVKGRVVLATRDRITPRATFFMRDAVGEFDAAALRSARIDLATVVSSIATSPQVVALYLRIWDDPANPYRIENVATPFTPRGSLDRAGYEYLCLQSDLDVVILAPDNRILLNRRLAIPPGMRATTAQLLQRFLTEDGTDIVIDDATAACQRHSASYDLDGVPFEQAAPVR